MKLQQQVKVALDETRILILGSQILLGFQMQAAFRDGFDLLPRNAQYADGVALMLMSVATICLIAPGLYHRIVEAGNDSPGIHRFISAMAGVALLPFALALGCDLGIVVEKLVDESAGIAAGIGTAALALFGWYGVEYLRRLKAGKRERAMERSRSDKTEKTPLVTRIDQMLTEARVILPGAQAVLGFQLIIVVTTAFDTLPPSAKAIHGFSLGLVALAVILLMAPAAYHRIVFAGEDTQELYNVGSILVVAATLPLGLGLAGDLYVVIAKIAQSAAVGSAAAALALLLAAGLWYVYPFSRRLRAGKKLHTFVR